MTIIVSQSSILLLCLCFGSMSAMLYFSSVQHIGGRYRCKSFTVVFGPTAPDESWQGAYISTSVLGEQRLLLYSHFNGIYEEEGELVD